MAGGPAETMIGVAAVGAGTLLLYAAYKNRKPFGVGGFVNTLIATGKWPDINKLPVWFEPSTHTGKYPADVQQALNDIKAKDPTFEAILEAEIDNIVSGKATAIDKAKWAAELSGLAKDWPSQAAVIAAYTASQKPSAESSSDGGVITV